jgi:hypothetical protein
MKAMADYLEPIHGISLKDYAAMAKKITAGVDEALVFKAAEQGGNVADDVEF